MKGKLVFRDYGVCKSGKFEILIVADKAILRNYKPDPFGRLVSVRGKFLLGAEGYDGFKHSINKMYELSSFVIRVNGKVLSMPKKEIEDIIVMTLKKSKDPNNYEAGVHVYSSKDKDRITVVLAGGDGVAAFIKSWSFDAKKGFVDSGVMGPP